MMISRFLTTTHTRKTAFSRPSTKFHALQRTGKAPLGSERRARRDQRGNAASSRHGGKTIPVVLRTAQDENRNRQRGRNEKEGEVGGSELQRAKEGGRVCAHTHTH